MIYGYQICFSIQFHRITNIDFPSAQTPTCLTTRASTLHDFGHPRITSKHGYYVNFLARCSPRGFTEDAPSRILPSRCDSIASSFETHRRHADELLFSLESNRTLDRHSFATYSGLGIDKIHFMFGARQRLRELIVAWWKTNFTRDWSKFLAMFGEIMLI